MTFDALMVVASLCAGNQKCVSNILKCVEIKRVQTYEKENKSGKMDIVHEFSFTDGFVNAINKCVLERKK